MLQTEYSIRVYGVAFNGLTISVNKVADSSADKIVEDIP